MHEERNKLLLMIEIAIFTALALVLDIIPFLNFKVGWANGGSISLAMIPIFIVAFRWGLVGGSLSGLLFGILKILFGATILHLFQGFMDYALAFTVLGVAGIFSTKVKNAFKQNNSLKAFIYITIGVFLGTGLRFLAHFYGGIVFFGEYAPEGQPAWLYSLVYNGGYMFPSFLICAIGIYLLFQAHPRTLFR